MRDSGEFIVIVAAVCDCQPILMHLELFKGLTDRVSHAGEPTFFADASCRNRSYTDRIFGLAGRVFGRANGALMSAFRVEESFDMVNGTSCM